MEEQRRRTRGEAAIEAQLKTLPPGSERHKLLTAARDFKASWVALGNLLTQVRETKSYKQWGHKTFDAYCRTELRLKPDTANKLTRSFSFLRDHEPVALERTERELPPLDVVDLLSRARERAKIPDEKFNEIREHAFEQEEGFATKNDVMKRFREVDPDAFKAQPRDPSKAAPVGDGNVRKALLLAERLESFLESIANVSSDCKSNASRVTGELRSLFDEARNAAA